MKQNRQICTQSHICRFISIICSQSHKPSLRILFPYCAAAHGKVPFPTAYLPTLTTYPSAPGLPTADVNAVPPRYSFFITAMVAFALVPSFLWIRISRSAIWRKSIWRFSSFSQLPSSHQIVYAIALLDNMSRTTFSGVI